LGLKPVVVLCRYEVVKDALLGHSEEFGGRPEIPLLVQLSKDYGFVSSNEKKWQELWRFTLSTLRDFGMGKNCMSQRVQQEAQHSVELLAKLKGDMGPVHPGPCGRQRAHNSLMGYVWSPDLAAAWKSTQTILNPLPTASLQEKSSLENMYSNEDLVMSVFDLFGARTVTTSNVLVFFLLILAKYPHIQAKVQEEIDAVVGTGCAPRSEDKLRMPYTNAVIHKLQRFCRTHMENFPWMTAQDIVFRGHTIPKGTTVIPVFYSVHTDPTQRENPKEVNPGHFLDEKGKFRKRESFLAFSAGKWMCPGEALARIELFLFLTTLLQSFTFQ
ncbi:CP2AC protein, partial [Haliaeetus albicilla]|nr:CP2AC protein [Haliaeetus albicilla]